MRSRHLPILVVLCLALMAVAFAVVAGPASGLPSFASTCNVTGCHATAAVGTVTATPSKTTPAPGATYTVAINNTLTAGGDSGYWITGNGVSKTGGPAVSTSFSASMTAPAAAGSYTYTVWVAKGKPNSGGMAKSATYTINVPVKEAITLKLNGKTTTVAILLGRSVKATGVITPTLTVPQVVKLTVQKWRPVTRRWAAVTTLSTKPATGAYSRSFTPAGRGTFRMRAVLAKTNVHTAATSVWRKFIVK